MAFSSSSSSSSSLSFSSLSSLSLSLSSLSAYPVVNAHLITKTNSGAIVSLLSVVLIVTLCVNEVVMFVQPVQKQKVCVRERSDSEESDSDSEEREK